MYIILIIGAVHNRADYFGLAMYELCIFMEVEVCIIWTQMRSILPTDVLIPLRMVYTHPSQTRLPSAMSSRSNSGNSAGRSSAGGSSVGGAASDYEDNIVAPPDTFAGDTCATPTPGDFLSRHPGAGLDSGSSTPQCLDSPLLEATQCMPKVSPLSTRQLKAADDPSSLLRATPNTVSGLARSSSSHNSSPSPCAGSNNREDLSCDDGPGSSSPHAVVPQDSAPTGGGRVLNIWSSSQHSLRPSKDSFTGDIPDYSLTPLSGSGTSIETETESTAAEGTDM